MKMTYLCPNCNLIRQSGIPAADFAPIMEQNLF